MTESPTISFVGTNDIKNWLEASAKRDDRSVSYFLRQLLEREMRRSQEQVESSDTRQVSQKI